MKTKLRRLHGVCISLIKSLLERELKGTKPAGFSEEEWKLYRQTVEEALLEIDEDVDPPAEFTLSLAYRQWLENNSHVKFPEDAYRTVKVPKEGRHG